MYLGFLESLIINALPNFHNSKWRPKKHNIIVNDKNLNGFIISDLKTYLDTFLDFFSEFYVGSEIFFIMGKSSIILLNGRSHYCGLTHRHFTHGQSMILDAVFMHFLRELTYAKCPYTLKIKK